MRSKQEEIEEEAEKKAVVQMAIGTLSYSELEAIEHILENLMEMKACLLQARLRIKSVSQDQ